MKPSTTSQESNPRQEFLTGARDQLPLLVGVIPFGMIFGALAVASGIPPLQAQGLSLFVFAGSSQFISAQMIGAGAPPLLVVFTILVVNLRHVLYSASMAPHLDRLPRRWKFGLAWLLTDEAFAMASLRFRKPPADLAHWYMLGTGLALWASWQVSTAAGILLGARVPESWQLDFALPLTFMALLVPVLTNWPSWGATLAAGLVSLVLAGLPYKLNLVLAIIAGIAAGLALERRWPPPREEAAR